MNFRNKQVTREPTRLVLLKHYFMQLQLLLHFGSYLCIREWAYSLLQQADLHILTHRPPKVICLVPKKLLLPIK